MKLKKHFHNKSMFAGASSIIFKRSEYLRINMTKSEESLWNVLKDRKRFKYKFRRQHPFQKYILDFYCHKLKLVIEIDGEYHFIPEQIEKDKNREDSLIKDGLFIIRFTNEEILNNLDACIDRINIFIYNFETKKICD